MMQIVVLKSELLLFRPLFLLNIRRRQRVPAPHQAEHDRHQDNIIELKFKRLVPRAVLAALNFGRF